MSDVKVDFKDLSSFAIILTVIIFTIYFMKKLSEALNTTTGKAVIIFLIGLALDVVILMKL